MRVQPHRPKRGGPAWRGVRMEVRFGPPRSWEPWQPYDPTINLRECMRAWVLYVAVGCGLPPKPPHTRVAVTTVRGRYVGLVRVYRGLHPTKDDLARLSQAMDLALGLAGPVCYSEG